MSEEKVLHAFKGFNTDMTCRGFQFKEGETYNHDGEVKVCEGGFHACAYPLDVFRYYPPATSVFHRVEQSGSVNAHDEDSKVASRTIKIGARVDIVGLISAAIEYTVSRCDPKKSNHTKAANSLASNSGYRGAASNSGDYGAASNSGDYGAASNSGYSGAASNSGDYGAASNSGYRGAASNSGDCGAASNSGYSGAASNSGYSGAASNSGKHGVAADFNGFGRVKSCSSGAIVCIRRNDDGSIAHIKAAKVGDGGIKPDTWYELDEFGNFQEA